MKDVATGVGFLESAVSKIKKQAIKRDWRPDNKPILELKWIVDSPRLGRSHALTDSQEEALIQSLEKTTLCTFDAVLRTRQPLSLRSA